MLISCFLFLPFILHFYLSLSCNPNVSLIVIIIQQNFKQYKSEAKHQVDLKHFQDGRLSSSCLEENSSGSTITPGLRRTQVAPLSPLSLLS